MKYILGILFSAWICSVQAQDFSFGKIKNSDFNIESELLNSSPEAVVLKEYGYANVELSPIRDKGFEIEYYYHVALKVLTKEGYDEGDFSIPLYIDNNSRETLVDIKGVTYNLEGDQLMKTSLEKENVITEKTSSTLNIVKVAFPQVKEGAIIELRYKTKSPFLFNLNKWEFQSDIPKLKSQFVTRIPEICTYQVNLRGGMPVTNREVENYNTELVSEVGEVRGDKTTYTMENIPAFVSEDYMTASKNFMSILSFELSRFSIPFGVTKSFSMTWDDVQKSLVDNESFGGQLKRKNQLREFIDPVIGNDDDAYSKANKIYKYIRQQVKWNKKHGVFADVGIKKALETRTGNSADINLALVNALNYAGISADAIILSTRDNGYPGLYTPGITDFNHVVARARIGDTDYFLDASTPYEPFGNLPLKCINYQGRNIPLTGNSDWVPLVANLVSSRRVIFNGELDEEGTLRGELALYSGGYNASNKRTEFEGYNSVEEYFENFAKKNTHFFLSNSTVGNRENETLLLEEKMEIEIVDFASAGNGSLQIQPIILGAHTKNPFNLEERSYPVDMAAKTQENYSITIKLPEGYVWTKEGLQDKISLALPERSARYIYSAKQEDDMLFVETTTQINKSIFLPEEYFNLKEFYNRLIQTEKNTIELKR
ncbi:DUF3857 domain-containing protein [Sphingobacterium shayense]|uniref:DUF3857 domain-containing protein n=1 Tax=Sphingobacterium shayense TaxID=626343 RepID=UPI001556CA32|nr:DUF3857 domain-containing protein [Sphingobacterium shayense]NQD72221.1 DUF3857 domain-containing protein [Sphingobacterium shayense]